MPHDVACVPSCTSSYVFGDIGDGLPFTFAFRRDLLAVMPTCMKMRM